MKRIVATRELCTVTVVCDVAAKGESGLIDLIEYIAGIGNSGHSFEIVVDPENSDTKKNFYFDGDGSDYIDEVSVEDNDAGRD